MASAPRIAVLLSFVLLACKSSSPNLDGGLDSGGGSGDVPPAPDVSGAMFDAASDLAPAVDVSGDAGGGDSAAPADLAVNPDGGSSAIGCAADLSGTWDLIASRPGEPPSTGVLVLGPTTFSVVLPDKRLTYTAGSKLAVWQRGGAPHVVSADNVRGPIGAFNAGSLPLPVDGTWTFQGNTERCTMRVSSVLVDGNCQSSAGDFSVGGSDWPGSIPSPRNGRTYFAARMASLPSQFGDLGGTWQAISTPDGDGFCEITVQGNTLLATCRDAGAFTGTTSLVIGSDCVASGRSSGHFEIGARRR
jgi:hypothetical protein